MTMQRPTMQQLQSVIGEPAYSIDDEKVGTVDKVLTDIETDVPEWIGIESGFLGTKTLLVPAMGVKVRGGDHPSLHVPYSKDLVKDTPSIGADTISEETERELYAHYGLDYPMRNLTDRIPDEAATWDDDKPTTMSTNGRPAPIGGSCR